MAKQKKRQRKLCRFSIRGETKNQTQNNQKGDHQLTTSQIIQHLREKSNLILVGYGGSHAYGTNMETSDIDIRGIYLNPENEVFGLHPDSEQITVPNEDVVIYSMKKMFHLLSNCNPNVIEILGLRPEDYIYMTDAGKQMIQNRHCFLSKKAIYTFGKYADSQLNRLVNKSGRAKDEIGNNETRSLQKVLAHAMQEFDLTNLSVELINDEPTLYLMTPLPISTFCRISQDILNVHADYKKSVRNDKAIAHDKLPKHMMHLLRLYMMGCDILSKQEIITYRADEHDLLMDIRNGKYLESDALTPTKEFNELIKEYASKFNETAAQSTLPDKPDMDIINQLYMQIMHMYY